MKVTWDAIDAATWDAHHARMGAALQQDWAYGACMKTLGVHVLRGWVTRNGGKHGFVFIRTCMACACDG